ncbi:MAG: hypothetical protein P8101_14545, partial [Candidatus Thiodiazotropha sp.]
ILRFESDFNGCSGFTLNIGFALFLSVVFVLVGTSFLSACIVPIRKPLCIYSRMQLQRTMLF